MVIERKGTAAERKSFVHDTSTVLVFVVDGDHWQGSCLLGYEQRRLFAFRTFRLTQDVVCFLLN